MKGNIKTKGPTIKSRLLKEADEIIEAMQYFKSRVEELDEDKIELHSPMYRTEVDLIMFKNKFKNNGTESNHHRQ